MFSYKGFTLIELLVVVLIIGVLAAVAVPQYQKAVERTRAQEGILALRTIQQSYDMYYITHGTYATEFAQLDVNFPWQGNAKWNTDPFVIKSMSNKEWSLQIYNTGSWNALLMGRIAGAYKGAGFSFFYQSPNQRLPTHSILCLERFARGVVFEKDPGAFCQKIMKGTLITEDNTVRYYSLPFNK